MILDVLIALLIWDILGIIRRVIVDVYLKHNPQTKNKWYKILNEK